MDSIRGTFVFADSILSESDELRAPPISSSCTLSSTLATYVNPLVFGFGSDIDLEPYHWWSIIARSHTTTVRVIVGNLFRVPNSSEGKSG